MLRTVFASLLILLLTATLPAAGRVTVGPEVIYQSPAGDRVAGALGTDPYNAILPSGRLVQPMGRSVVVGMNTLGFALSPDGRYAITSNDDQLDRDARSALEPSVGGGYSLTVVQTDSMRVTSQYRDPKLSFFVGIVSVRDPADAKRTLVLASGGPSDSVAVFDLDAQGRLTPDAVPTVVLPAAVSATDANAGHVFPASIAVSRDHTKAYVVDNVADRLSVIDLRTRTVDGDGIAVGYFPYGVALLGNHAYVTNEGLTFYRKLPAPVSAPAFAAPATDPERSSSISSLEFGANGMPRAGASTSLLMDRTPDGFADVGGAHPSAIVIEPKHRFAYVAMSGVDRIATVTLGPPLRVVGGTELRLFDRGPYGTQPDALALSHDGERLYVALAGINAVAVIDAHDPVHLHRLGLIPTGWWPSALALAHNDSVLYVANAKGFGHDRGFTGDGGALDSNDIWSTFERIDLHAINPAETTRRALVSLRRALPLTNDPVVPQRFAATPSSVIHHVFLILEENKTYDSMFGDLRDGSGLPYGPGDPQFTAFGSSVTPNLHELAREFALAGNFYADSEESDAGHQYVSAGITSVYSEKTLLVKHGREPLVNKNEDPEDYPRAGYIFNSLHQTALGYRDYGDLIRLSGYDEGKAEDPRTDDPNFVSDTDEAAPTRGLGGVYSLDVPAPVALLDHIDLNYPGWNLRIRDVRRAKEFIRDFGALVARGAEPAFTEIWLPNDHGGHGAHIPPLPEEVADGDRALGMIVEYLSHLPSWNSTAIFIAPDDAQSTQDHVNAHRSYAVVVSPYAKRRYLEMRHLSTVSVLKTEEELLGLPVLSLGDLLATDAATMFTSTPDLEPFSAHPAPTQHASAEGERIAALLEQTNQRGPDADPRAARLVEAARRADMLAMRRAAMSPAVYAAQQAQLLRAARQVVETAGKPARW